MRPLYFLHAWQVVCKCPWSLYAGMYITSDRVNSAVNGVGRGQMDMDNPAKYGFIKKRIVPLGLKRLVIGTIRYPFKTLRNRNKPYPVPFNPYIEEFPVLNG